MARVRTCLSTSLPRAKEPTRCTSARSACELSDPDQAGIAAADRRRWRTLVLSVATLGFGEQAPVTVAGNATSDDSKESDEVPMLLSTASAMGDQELNVASSAASVGC